LAAWIPSNFDEVCKRNAGRRKLHMRKRQARADRIVRLVTSMDFARAAGLRATVYGSITITITSQATEVSKATASRDCALVRRIYRQFLRMFGRPYYRNIAESSYFCTTAAALAFFFAFGFVRLWTGN
jgi:hypothetical protein